MGGSGCGKDSIVQQLSQYGYKQVISYSTRPRREGEGDTHIFINPKEVEQYKPNIAAYTRIGEYEYFTTVDQLKEVDLYVIDAEGYKYLKDTIKDIKFIPIYINVSEKDRFQRALKRGDRKEIIEKRFCDENIQFQMFKENEVFYSVPNYSIDKAVNIILKIIEVESSR